MGKKTAKKENVPSAKNIAEIKPPKKKKERHQKNDRVYHLLKLLASKSRVKAFLNFGGTEGIEVTRSVAQKLKVKTVYAFG